MLRRVVVIPMKDSSENLRSLLSLRERAVAFAMTFCVLFAPLPAFALDDEAMMARAETILFGKPNKGENMESRLETAERQVFGKRKNGSIDERLERLSSTLLLHRTPNNAVIAIPNEKATSLEKSASSKKGDYDFYKAQKEEKERKKAVEKLAKRKNSKKYKFEESSPPAEPAKVAEEIKPVEAKPVEAKPVEKKPVEEKPIVEKPVVEKSTDIKPAEITTPKATAVAVTPPVVQHETVKRTEISESQEVIKNKSKTSLSPAAPKLISPLKAMTPKSDIQTKAPVKPAPINNSVASSSRIKRNGNEQNQRAAALLREGMQAHNEGNDAKAEHLFKQVVLLQPRNPDGYFNLGAVAEQKGDLAGALMSYRAALNLNPHDNELKEAVNAVEGMLDPSATSPSIAQTTNSRSKGTTGGAKPNSKPASSTSPKSSPQASAYPPAAPDRFVQTEQAASNSERFADDGGYSYGAGQRRTRHARANVYPHNAPELTTKSIQDAAVAEVSDNPPPELSVTPYSAPIVSANQPQPFQLATARSRANSTANQTSARPRGNGGGAARAVMGVAFSVGTSYALRASGLHCPICRIGGGGGGLRSLLRF